MFSRPFLGAEGKGHRSFCVVLNQCLKQVERSSQAQQNTLAEALGQTAAWPGAGAAIPLGHSQAEGLGFPPGDFPKFRVLKAFHLLLLRTAQTSQQVFVGYKIEHLLINHHHSGDLKGFPSLAHFCTQTRAGSDSRYR